MSTSTSSNPIQLFYGAGWNAWEEYLSKALSFLNNGVGSSSYSYQKQSVIVEGQVLPPLWVYILTLNNKPIMLGLTNAEGEELPFTLEPTHIGIEPNPLDYAKTLARLLGLVWKAAPKPDDPPEPDSPVGAFQAHDPTWGDLFSPAKGDKLGENSTYRPTGANFWFQKVRVSPFSMLWALRWDT